jgi:hypothetical protein
MTLCQRVSTLMIFLVLTSCSSAPTKTTDSPEWRGRMQGFAQDMYLLYPLASDPAAFRDPENRSRIDDAVSTLALMAHEMDKVTTSAIDYKPANVDPEVKVLAGTFKHDMTAAVVAFRKGDYEFARSSIHGALQLCIQCHSRMPDNQNRKFILDPQGVATMKPLFRADFMAAARNFDGALSTYKQIIDYQSLARSHSTEWENAAQNAVAISVRVKNDPDLSESIVDTILKSKDAPHFFLAKAQQWKTQIEEWRSNSLKLKKGSNDLERAESLIRYSRDSKGPFYGDARSAYIYLLRATAYLHSFVHQSNDPVSSGKAFMLLGQCYEILQGPGDVSLSKNYYKACIVGAPHTSVSSQCYDRYEESVYMDSIGGASSLPLDSVDYLEYLRGLSMP